MNTDLNLFLQAWTGGGDVSDEECQHILNQLRENAEFRAECVAEIRLLGMCKTIQSSPPRWLELSEILGINGLQSVSEKLDRTEVSQNASSDDFARGIMKQVERHDSSRKHGWWSWFSWRPLTAAAAGLMIGLGSASVVWAVARPGPGFELRKVLIEGFESTGLEFVGKFPERAGVWNGEGAAIVESETAAEGQYVLRFYPKKSRKISHINHLLDLSQLPVPVGNEKRRLRFSAKVRSLEDVPSVHRYSVRLGTFADDVVKTREQWFSGAYGADSALTSASRSLKSSEEGWVSLEAVLPLTPDAQHVVVSIGISSLDEAKAKAVHEVDALELELVTSKQFVNY